MMRDIDELLPQVLKHARSCPEPLAFDEIRAAARTLCHKSRIWRESDSLPVALPEAEGICSIADADIVAIEQPRLDGEALQPKTLAWLDENHVGWKDAADPPARYVTQLTPNSITIVPAVAGTFEARFVLQPSRSATTLPGFLIDSCGDLIAMGAAAALLLLPGTEFGNAQLGAALDGRFRAAVAALEFQTAKGQQGGRLRTRPHHF